MVSRSVVFRVLLLGCYVGGVGLSGLVASPAHAAENAWSRTSGQAGLTACGAASLGPVATCMVDYYNANVACGVSGGAAACDYVLLSITHTDATLPTLAAAIGVEATHPMADFEAYAGFAFVDSCSTLSKSYNTTFAGCAEICTAPDTLNTETGLCEAPPDCSVIEGIEADRFYSDTGPGGAICANPPGSEDAECSALVAEPAGVRACADGECFARLVFTGDQCGAEPDATGETLAEEPGNTNCVSGDGVTFCAAKTSLNCGTVNGESICLESVPEGNCAFLGNGGLLCSDSASGPTQSDGVTPAAPDGTFSAASDDNAGDTFNYYGPSTVNESGTAITGTMDTGTTDAAEETPGACEEAGSCPGTLPELGETETIGDATSAFLASVQSSPLISAAMGIGASWPAGECPAPSATIEALGGMLLTLDAHCTFWAEWGGVLATVLLALFVFLGVRIVLSA